MNPDFRFRGEEHSRIEALSDAVFALAITLLVISQKVPNSFAELKIFLTDLFPFAICMTFILLIWHEHFIFFVRYGFRNTGIEVRNAVLLFLILFYVYPLKFLARVIMDTSILPFFIGSEKAHQIVNKMINPQDYPFFMVIYGIGAGVIFLVFSSMYKYAYKRRKELRLSALEVFDTRTRVYFNFLMASVPLLSAVLAILAIILQNTRLMQISSFSYILYWPIPVLFWKYRDRFRKKVRATYTY